MKGRDHVDSYTCISICTGIGMLDHGVDLAIGGTLRPILVVEGEAFSCANLVYQMEQSVMAETPIWSDLNTLTGDECREYVRTVLAGRPLDFLIGGIPCQPWSVAGQQAGIDDERDLWPATLKAVVAYEPTCVFIENVSGFASEPLGLRRVANDLRELGYRVASGLFSSAECGANHGRQRCFVLGKRLENTDGK